MVLVWSRVGGASRSNRNAAQRRHTFMKQGVCSGASWEQLTAYCGAAAAGPFLAVARTTITEEDGPVVGSGGLYAQATFVSQEIGIALTDLGASLTDLISSKARACDEDWPEGVVLVHKVPPGELRRSREPHRPSAGDRIRGRRRSSRVIAVGTP